MNAIKPNWPANSHIHALTTVIGSSSKETLVEEFHLPASPMWPNQNHSAVAIEAARLDEKQICDAVYTQEKGVVCAISTADCLPVLITDQAGQHIAAIHAGWRGLAAGIIQNTLNQMPIAPKDALVWLGPAIGACHFEVGADVYQAFTKSHEENACAFIQTKPDKWHADLYALARLILSRLGITAVFGGEYCTYRDEALFYSFRRDKAHPGRLLTLIWMS